MEQKILELLPIFIEEVKVTEKMYVIEKEWCGKLCDEKYYQWNLYIDKAYVYSEKSKVARKEREERRKQWEKILNRKSLS